MSVVMGNKVLMSSCINRENIIGNSYLKRKLCNLLQFFQLYNSCNSCTIHMYWVIRAGLHHRSPGV